MTIHKQRGRHEQSHHDHDILCLCIMEKLLKRIMFNEFVVSCKGIFIAVLLHRKCRIYTICTRDCKLQIHVVRNLRRLRNRKL